MIKSDLEKFEDGPRVMLKDSLPAAIKPDLFKLPESGSMMRLAYDVYTTTKQRRPMIPDRTMIDVLSRVMSIKYPVAVGYHNMVIIIHNDYTQSKL